MLLNVNEEVSLRVCASCSSCPPEGPFGVQHDLGLDYIFKGLL